MKVHVKNFYIDLEKITNDIYLRLDYHYWIWKKNNQSPPNKIKLRLLIKKLENGNAIKREDYADYETDYVHIVPRNVQRGDFVERDLIFLKDETGERLERYSVKNGDILLVISSNCGDCLYFDLSKLPGHLKEKQFTTSHYIVKIRTKDFINAKVLSYYINYIKDYFRAVETGKTQKNLPLYYVFNIPISFSLLDKNKQDYLLIKISQIEQEISKLKARIKEPKLIVDEIFSKYFTLDLRKYSDLEKKHIFGENLSNISKSAQLRSSLKSHHPKYEFILEKVKGYKTVKLKQLLKEPIRRGVQPEYDDEGEILVVKTANLRNGYIDLSEAEYVNIEFFDNKRKKAGIKNLDVLIASTGTGSIGKVDIWEKEEEALADGHISIIRVNQNKVNPYYLTYYLRSIFGYSQVEINFSGMSNQIEIYPDEIERFEILLPDISIQNQIVMEIEEKLKAQKEITKQIESLKREIDSLIEKACFRIGN